MTVVPGVPCARMAIEISDDDCDVPGLAHLWLRHLPPSFLRRMACVNMQWAAAVSSLELWRADMDHSAYTHALLDLYDHEGGSDARRADSPSSTRSEHGDGSSDGDPSDDPSSHFLDRLSRPASDYGVDAATYLAIVTGDLAGVPLD